MERGIALKRLGKLLGKNCGYRIDPKAPTAEEREAARAGWQELADRKRVAVEAREARIKHLLDNDAEYQTLKAAAKKASDAAAANGALRMSYKITVGVSNGMFFHVKAQGDSWEEIFAKLK